MDVFTSARMPAGCWSHIFSFHSFFRGRADEIELRRQCRVFRAALPHPLPVKGVRVGRVAGPWARESLRVAEELICSLLARRDLPGIEQWTPEIRLVEEEVNAMGSDGEDGAKESDARRRWPMLKVRAPRLRIVGDVDGGLARPVLRSGVICERSCASLTLDNIVVKDRGLTIRGGPTKLLCRNVEFRAIDSGSAVSVQGKSSLDMRSCRIVDIRGYGVSVIGMGTRARLQGVTVLGCFHSGVWVYMGGRAEIADCQISRCTEYGLHAHGSEHFPCRIDVTGSAEFSANTGGDWFEQTPHDRVQHGRLA